MELKSYGVKIFNFETLSSHWLRLRPFFAVSPCDRAVDGFPKWYDIWKSAQKWGHESQFFDLVIFLTNTKKFKNPWLGAPGTFFGLFQWCQGMFLKVPEGFQRKNFLSCTETLLLPSIPSFVFQNAIRTFNWHYVWNYSLTSTQEPRLLDALKRGEAQFIWHLYGTKTFLPCVF